MSGKKNIDRLFQEKFKDFEVSPSKSVWGRIESELDSNAKKERKILPLWWKLGGIAAILALLIAIGYNTLVDDRGINEKNNMITNLESESSEEKENTNEIDLFNNENSQVNNNVVENSSELESNIGSKNSEPSVNNFTEINNMINEDISNENITASNTKNHEKIKKNFDRVKNNNENNTTIVNPITIQNDKNSPKKINSAVVDNSIDKINTSEDQNNITNKNDALLKNTSPSEKEEEVIVKNEGNNDGKKSLLDVAEEQQKEKENEEIAKTSYNKWSINPNVAPVYYNTIGNGSPINSQFSDNNKEGAINMSYGINVAYQLNDKLSIRSGVNKVDFGYSTQDIEFTSSIQGAAIETVNYSSRASNIKVIDNTTVNVSDQSQAFGLNSFSSLEVLESTSAINVFEGSMNQQFGYLEIPLELKYRILNKKFGVNVIGGISSLFLTKNQITVESNSLVTEIGEANNLSNTNFSTNVGFGFDYSFTKNIQFNIEPMFKYQLNAFSNNDGGFKPYSLGVYTGINFKF